MEVQAVLMLATCALTAQGHFIMTTPLPRGGASTKNEAMDCFHNNHCVWFNQGCTIGCSACTGENCLGSSCCNNSMEPTNNENLTYPDTSPWPEVVDFTKHNPWRAPGHAPVASSCGIASGWYTDGVDGNGGYVPDGTSMGDDGRDLPPTLATVWQAGSQQEVGFWIFANHGGGYAYRLCPASENLTEECFQRHHLQFAGNSSWIRYEGGNGTTTTIPALRVTEGTSPAGAMWTRNPIPACSTIYGGGQYQPGCETAQFEPPMESPGLGGVAADGLYGFGQGRCDSGLPGQNCSDDELDFWGKRFHFEIVDLVEIPENLPAGKYVLSFRLDGEQTPQIWSSCSDIEILPRKTGLRGAR